MEVGENAEGDKSRSKSLLKYIEDKMDHSLFDRFTNIYVGRVMLDKTPDDDPHEASQPPSFAGD